MVLIQVDSYITYEYKWFKGCNFPSNRSMDAWNLVDRLQVWLLDPWIDDKWRGGSFCWTCHCQFPKFLKPISSFLQGFSFIMCVVSFLRKFSSPARGLPPVFVSTLSLPLESPQSSRTHLRGTFEGGPCYWSFLPRRLRCCRCFCDSVGVHSWGVAMPVWGSGCFDTFWDSLVS